MSQFLFKTILDGCRTVRTSQPTTSNLSFLGDPTVLLLRWISSSSKEQPFTVSYLKNSLGLSSQAALSVSKYVKFDSPERPDKMIKFFKDRGFTTVQISRLVRAFPKVFLYNAEKTILPKLEFLESKGISGPEIAEKVSVFPSVLKSSLDNQIMPSYNYIRNLLQSDEKVIAVVKAFPDVLIRNVNKFVSPKIDILREHGVPDSSIATLIQHFPKTLSVSPDCFRKTVQRVEGMGFDASKINFVVAVHVLWWMSKSKWESKVDAYKKWGWSDEEVLKAFKKSPWCMSISEDKLIECMDFFINQMGWRPCLIAECPLILNVSFKKRVVPRCSVFQILLTKGLLEEEEVNLNSLLMSSEKRFLRRFVVPYKEEAPDLFKLYKEQLDLSKGPKIDYKV